MTEMRRDEVMQTGPLLDPFGEEENGKAWKKEGKRKTAREKKEGNKRTASYGFPRYRSCGPERPNCSPPMDCILWPNHLRLYSLFIRIRSGILVSSLLTFVHALICSSFAEIICVQS